MITHIANDNRRSPQNAEKEKAVCLPPDRCSDEQSLIVHQDPPTLTFATSDRPYKPKERLETYS